MLEFFFFVHVGARLLQLIHDGSKTINKYRLVCIIHACMCIEAKINKTHAVYYSVYTVIL